LAGLVDPATAAAAAAAVVAARKAAALRRAAAPASAAMPMMVVVVMASPGRGGLGCRDGDQPDEAAAEQTQRPTPRSSSPGFDKSIKPDRVHRMPPISQSIQEDRRCPNRDGHEQNYSVLGNALCDAIQHDEASGG
jgi:hypothetical protein